MNILKTKQYGQSSNQNLIMTRSQFNKTFTSAAIVLQFEKHLQIIVVKVLLNWPLNAAVLLNFGVCYVANRSQ